MTDVVEVLWFQCADLKLRTIPAGIPRSAAAKADYDNRLRRRKEILAKWGMHRVAIRDVIGAVVSLIYDVRCSGSVPLSYSFQ